MVKRNLRRNQRSSPAKMAGQRRPEGTFRTATVKWKLAVIARMKELGITRAEMSRRLMRYNGTGTAQALKDLLGRIGDKPVESSTKLMPAIHHVLGWEPIIDDAEPEKSTDKLRDEFFSMWPDLDQSVRDYIEFVVAKRTRERDGKP